MQPLLIPRDAGKILGVGPARMQQFDRDGRLRAIRDSAGRRLFREADVLRFKRERERQAAERQQMAAVK